MSVPRRLRVPVLLLASVVGADAVAQEASPGEAPASHAADAAVAPKVLVLTMFGGEAEPWLEGEEITPGLRGGYPELACAGEDLYVMTTAMGFANAASSVSALVWSEQVDLSDTYILIAGIAGVNPEFGTLGSALWAPYAIDGGLRHEIDPRQMRDNASGGVVALGAEAPGEPAGWAAGTEVDALNPDLAQRAYEITRDVELADSPEAQAYRATYEAEAARAEPAVGLCDTVSSDTYWHGSLTGEAMEEWVRLLTDGAARYCTTQMEDNATLTALRRGAEAGRLDFDRIAVLRTASNFDREAPGQEALASLTATSGGFGPAMENAYRIGTAFARR
jgi:purine nucleoside permease